MMFNGSKRFGKRLPADAGVMRLRNEQQVQLAPHRIHAMGSALAVVAEQSTGWCLLSRADYDVLFRELNRSLRPVAGFSQSERQVLDALAGAGLLMVHPQDAAASNKESGEAPETLLLKLTGSCNYACTYCYDYSRARFKHQLDAGRALDTIEAILARRDRLNLLFHGGEPLLRFDLVRRIVEDVSNRLGASGRVSYSIQTNGSLLDDEVVSFLDRHDFSVGISLDGPNADANVHRVTRSGANVFSRVASLFEQFPAFLQKRCGFLAVATRSSLPYLPEFALWLQDKGIKSLGITFMDEEGAGKGLSAESVTPEEAVRLFDTFMSYVEAGKISSLALSPLLSRINNLFTLNPRDYCTKGPCAAASEFMVLDADGGLRGCDCIDDPFMHVADASASLTEALQTVSKPKRAILDRHHRLRTEGVTCSRCPLFGLCGGTCPAKALISAGTLNAVDPLECAVSKFIYPKLLEQYQHHAESAPLFRYYFRHKRSGLSAVNG